MSQVVLHLGEQYIEEDLEYYFSGERDKNNQVRPDEKIYSMTPFSEHLEMDFSDGKVGNFFYPVLPEALDRIYIGISISLFANYWGASFLLELLKYLKPGGSVVLPVYPEGQAHEKDFWSRSFLENIFLSRERWTGFSNITAENDGVMSMRVGRKWPAPMPSSIEWFFKERSNLLLAGLQQGYQGDDVAAHLRTVFVPLCKMMWREYTMSALLDRIIKEYIGKKFAVKLIHIGRDYGLLANDILLSPSVSIECATSYHVGDVNNALKDSIARYFCAHTEDKHSLHTADKASEIENTSESNLIVISQLYSSMSASEYQQLLQALMDKLDSQGVLIVYEDLSASTEDVATLDAMMGSLGQVITHSPIAARSIEPSIEISQYSLAVEENLRQEKLTRGNVFRVVQKM